MEQIKSIDEILIYLKNLLEGRSTVHVNVWIKYNSEAISNLLSRNDYLKIKFDPIEFAREFLKKSFITYSENKNHSRYENYLMTFAAEALTNDGNIKEEWFNKVFDGALKNFTSGNIVLFKKDINKYLQRMQGSSSILTEGTSDLLYFAETISTQNKKLSIAIVESISEFFYKKGLLVSEVDRIKEYINGV